MVALWYLNIQSQIVPCQILWLGQLYCSFKIKPYTKVLFQLFADIQCRKSTFCVNKRWWHTEVKNHPDMYTNVICINTTNMNVQVLWLLYITKTVIITYTTVRKFVDLFKMFWILLFSQRLHFTFYYNLRYLFFCYIF